VENEERRTLHDVVSVGDESETDGQRHDGNLPKWDLLLRSDSLAGVPGTVHTSPDTDGVTDIVGTVSERSSASSDDLDEGVEILDLVGVLGSMSINAVHTTALRSTENANLSLVDIVVHTVETGDDNIGGEAVAEGSKIVALIDGTGAHGVPVDEAHSPAKGALLLSQLGVMLLASLLEEVFVLGIGILVVETTLDASGSADLAVGVTVRSIVRVGTLLCDLARDLKVGSVALVVVAAVLDDRIVGNLDFGGILRRRALEQKRAQDNVL
jgi:hypothetical protein